MIDTDDLRTRAVYYALGRIEEASGRTGDPEERTTRFGDWVEGGWSQLTDGRTMADRWEQFTHHGRHWHVRRHDEDDDPFVTYDRGAALDYAAMELDALSDHVHQGATIAAESGDFREAWETLQRVNVWSTLVTNLRNLVKQHTADERDRAPLYRGEGAGDRLTVAVHHSLDQLAGNGPRDFVVRECMDDECRPRPMGEDD